MRFASARAFGNLPSIHHKMFSIIQLVIIHQPKTSHKFYNLDNIRKYIFAHLHSQNSLSQMVGLHIPSLNFRHNQIGSEVRAIVDNKHFVECFPRQPLCILKVFFILLSDGSMKKGKNWMVIEQNYRLDMMAHKIRLHLANGYLILPVIHISTSREYATRLGPWSYAKTIVLFFQGKVFRRLGTSVMLDSRLGWKWWNYYGC